MIKNSPFAQPEECLSVANSPGQPQMEIHCRSGFEGRRALSLKKTQAHPTHWTHIPRLKLQCVAGNPGNLLLFRTIQQCCAAG
jgi:hypothetical protein